MIKKLQKGIVLTASILFLFFIYGFSLKSYDIYSGKETVKYWKDNKQLFESVNQDQDLLFKNLEPYILTNDLFLLGEFHGIKETIDIDVNLIKYLNAKAKMKIHLPEIDFSQAYFLNEYLRTGNERLIDYVLNSWIIYHGHNNKDYKNKWIEIYKLNQSNPADLKIRVYGIDKIQNLEVAQKHLRILLEKLKIKPVFPTDEKLFLEWVKAALPSLITSQKNENDSIVEDIMFLRKNLIDYRTLPREKIMFSNFKYFYKRFNFKNEKIYGYFGEAHVLQKEMSSKKDFGALAADDQFLKDKTYTIISRYLDSKMAAPSKFLPFFLKSGNEHTKTAVSCDNSLLLYHSGIIDLKDVTANNTNTFFDLNQKDSPYRTSTKLIKSFGMLSLFSGMKITDKKSFSSDYAQAIILIRNSDWAEPSK